MSKEHHVKRTAIENDILQILNNNSDIDEKRKMLHSMKSTRRGENRKLLIAVADMLYS